MDDVREIAVDVVRAKVYFSGVMMCVGKVAAGSGPRSEGVATVRGAGDCGGEVVALPIPPRAGFSQTKRYTGSRAACRASKNPGEVDGCERKLAESCTPRSRSADIAGFTIIFATHWRRMSLQIPPTSVRK